jgi:hypothetical protein
VRELSVVGVRVELPSNQPIVLLREVDGDRYLPIWIGAVEATAIAYEQQGVKPARPLTHDLLRDILSALKAPLKAVEITELKENVFYADLLIGDSLRVSARPSPASSSRTSRRTRWRSSASSSTRSARRISRAEPAGVASTVTKGLVVRTRRVAALPPCFPAR